ncbi:MAG: ComF family protein [Gammaproteobacteria bacterium]|nr:ComF family protein [Gammaproteobacteria bacterium]MDH3446883.1 ComF family protein [Gammaproteobacteria bacterium]
MSGTGLKRAFNRCINYLLAPGICLACGCELENADSLCASCQEHIRLVPSPCACCAQPSPIAGRVCPACLLNPPRWQKMIAPLQYRGLVRDYLLQLKFSEALYLSRTLCEQCMKPFGRSLPRPEVLLPVPLHRDRLLERGYNQALEIALVWSRGLGIPVDRRALTRPRATLSQSGLSAAQRGRNVARAFAYSPRRRYRHVAVVDDIVTTGSTISEITRVLHRAGVEYVEVWALARVYRR